MDVKAIIDIFTGEYGYVAGIIALAFLTISFIISFSYRNKLVIKIVPSSKDLPDSFESFEARVRDKIAKISQIHRRAKEAASDINIFRDLSMPAGGEAIEIQEEFEKLITKELKGPVKLLVLIFKWLFRPPQITGQVLLAKFSKEGNFVNGDVTISCRYIPRRGKGQMVQIDPVKYSGIADSNLGARAEELALKIVMLLSDNVGTSSWNALKLVTEALKEWPDTTMRSQEADTFFEKSNSKLKQALEYDPTSPLVHYNLALILYYEYGDRQIADALKHFDLASQTPVNRFHYLGKTGVARCYCQNYHRLGKQTPKDLTQARIAAAEAITLIEEEKDTLLLEKWTGPLKVDYARAKYCQAFALHVTEKDKDIDGGVKAYMDILRMYAEPPREDIFNYPGDLTEAIKILNKTMPAVPAVFYNNLGYILMARGGRFKEKNEESQNYYNMAKGFLKLGLRRDSNYKFARANLGNLERLFRNYDQAVYQYERAIALDPKYVNGYSELSWVYLDANQPDKAQEAHETALGYAVLDSHKSKVKEYYARAHWRIGAIEKAKQLVLKAIENDQKNENYELLDWIKSEEDLQKFLEQEQVEWRLLR